MLRASGLPDVSGIRQVSDFYYRSHHVLVCMYMSMHVGVCA